MCFQCSKCSSGCPLSERMDLKPAQMMHSIRLNREEAVLHSRAIWLCMGCETCAARCPYQVEPAAAMTAARALALQKGIQPSVKEVGIYYRQFVNNMRLNGKIHDISVVAITGLLTGRLLNELPLALRLLIRGRVKPPPLPIGGNPFRRIYSNARAREEALSR